MNFSETQEKLLEYDSLLFDFKPQTMETADEEWIAMLCI